MRYVSNGSSANTMTLTYTAGAGGIANGKVSLQVPSGWSAPSTTPTDPGYITSSLGSLAVSNRTVTVSSLTLGPNASVSRCAMPDEGSSSSSTFGS